MIYHLSSLRKTKQFQNCFFYIIRKNSTYLFFCNTCTSVSDLFCRDAVFCYEGNQLSWSSLNQTCFPQSGFRKQLFMCLMINNLLKKLFMCLSYVCCPLLGPPQNRCLSINRSKTGVSCLRNTHCSPVGSSAFEFTNCFTNKTNQFVIGILFVSLILTELRRKISVLHGGFIDSYSDEIYSVICLTVLCE